VGVVFGDMDFEINELSVHAQTLSMEQSIYITLEICGKMCGNNYIVYRQSRKQCKITSSLKSASVSLRVIAV